MLQILGMLEKFDIGALAPNSAAAVHLFAEASRLAYADRDLYIADPDFVTVPADGLLDRSYLQARASLIDVDKAAESVAAGVPPGAESLTRRGAGSTEPPGTTHLSVVDRHGNAVALTSSIEFAFGSGLMVRGFLLNNQLTDFSFAPERDGRAVANRVESDKRPRSSMAPTMVFDDGGRLRLVVGSPGGSRIICYVAKTLVAVIDWKLDLQSRGRPASPVQPGRRDRARTRHGARVARGGSGRSGACRRRARHEQRTARRPARPRRRGSCPVRRGRSAPRRGGRRPLNGAARLSILAGMFGSPSIRLCCVTLAGPAALAARTGVSKAESSAIFTE